MNSHLLFDLVLHQKRLNQTLSFLNLVLIRNPGYHYNQISEHPLLTRSFYAALNFSLITLKSLTDLKDNKDPPNIDDSLFDPLLNNIGNEKHDLAVNYGNFP